MPVPSSQEIYKPLLEAFKDEVPHSFAVNKILEIVAASLGVSLEEMSTTEKTAFKNNINDAKLYLRKKKFLSHPSKNTYMITPAGLDELGVRSEELEVNNEPEEVVTETESEPEAELELEPEADENIPVDFSEQEFLDAPEEEISNKEAEVNNESEEVTTETESEPEAEENIPVDFSEQEFLDVPEEEISNEEEAEVNNEPEEVITESESEPEENSDLTAVPDDFEEENFDDDDLVDTVEASSNEEVNANEELEIESEPEENVPADFSEQEFLDAPEEDLEASEEEAEDRSEELEMIDEPEEVITESEEPEEISGNSAADIEEVLTKYNDSLAEKVLEKISNIHQDTFCMLVMDLLSKMGYRAFQNARYTNEAEGSDLIHGVILEDKAGMNPIFIQARKISPSRTIGKADMQDFAKAISDKGGKGMFVTSGSFSEQAKVIANDERIMLMDGKKLADLMIANNFCVNVQRVFELKSIDLESFSEYED